VELQALEPGEGEEEALSAERERLQHAEKIADAYNTAAAALAGEGRSVEERLSAASRTIARVSEWAGPAGQAAEAALERALIEVAEAEAQLDAAARDLEAEPERLEDIEKRLFALRGAARKHRTTVDALPALLIRVRDDVASIEGGALELGRLEKAVAEAEAAYRQAALALREKRLTAAARLSEAVSDELAPLKLGSARFSVEVTELPPEQATAEGVDRVRFLTATNAGSPPGPLNKIASGGELSRFLLALNVVLADTGPVGTLIFDEVDRGVGGATAEAVGDRLARLARHYQVLVVTHSPQVAACARHHWRIEKGDRDGKALTRVEALDATGRREEIARMLSGAEVSAEARAAADRLIEGLAS
jgi:DNA repair protein RecN (Recombination protein N)